MRIENIHERKFYEIESINENWSLRELKRQFNSALYERLAASRNKKKIKELDDQNQNQTTSANNSLLIANDKLSETNEKFAAVNKELAAVNKELAQVNENIKQYQEKQNEFINIISHELKTPIQAIIGYIELFLNNLKKNLNMGDV